VHGSDLRSKNIDAFKKEWTLLFKENREALIGSDHQLVRLNLREVGINSEVERNLRRQTVLSRQARIKLDWFVDKPSARRHLSDSHRSLALTGLRKGQTGNQFQRPFTGDAFQSRDVALLTKQT